MGKSVMVQLGCLTNFWEGQQNVLLELKEVKCFQLEMGHNQNLSLITRGAG
jgi:hypothetical protein